MTEVTEIISIPKWPLVTYERPLALTKSKLNRILNRADHETFHTEIDLDRKCCEACLKIGQRQLLEAVLAHAAAPEHPASAQVQNELRRLYPERWPDTATA